MQGGAIKKTPAGRSGETVKGLKTSNPASQTSAANTNPGAKPGAKPGANQRVNQSANQSGNKKVSNNAINNEPAKTPKPAESPVNQQQVSKAELSKLGSRKEMVVAMGLCVFLLALFFVGRAYYDDRYYTPEEGLGYWLGLTGGVMMLLGMAYTAFKYIGVLRTRAVMKHWLTIHIWLGILGPILVMIHSTFHLGSLNGAIAFITMQLVVISGIMGRYLYSKTHYGLGGRKAQVKDLHQMLKLAGHKIKSESLDRFTESVLTPKHTLGNAFWDLFTFGWRSRWLYFRLTENMRHLLYQLAQEKGWDKSMVREKRREFKSQLRAYILMLKKVALFKVYERFFAFWRNAHVPLIYLLLMSGVVHVIAVHMY